MRAGISSATFFNKLFNEDVFDELRRMDCGVCEVFLTTYSEYGEEFAKLLASRMGDIEVHSVHTLNTQFEPELFNKNPRTFADAFALYEKVLAGARVLGAKNYTFHGPSRLKKREYKFDFDFLGERAELLCRRAAEFGVTLCYENVHWTYFSEPSYFRELAAHAPELGSCLDIKQAMQSGIDYREFIGAMGDTIRTVHLCDYDENGKLTLPGRGIFDFRGLVRALRDSGVDAPLLLELYSSDYESFDEVRESFEYIKSLL